MSTAAPSAVEAQTSTWTIGVDLPWVVPWSGEAEFGLRPSEAFRGMLDLVQVERPGTGTPMPSGMNLMRQRRGVAEHRCHVCGEVTPAGDRFLFPKVTGTFLKVRGRTRYATHLPPTHAACAARAQSLCPHLRSAFARPVAFPHDVGVLAPERSVPESLQHLASSLPTGSPVAFSYYRVFGEGFTRVVQRLRAE